MLENQIRASSDYSNSKEKTYDLLIVGSGFDLASGFQTSYRSFLTYYRNKGIQNPLIYFFIDAYDKGFILNNEWNGFENLLCQYLQFLDFLFTSNDVERYFSTKFQQPSQNTSNAHYHFDIKNLISLPENIILILKLQNPLQGVLIFAHDKDFKDLIYNGPGLNSNGQKSLFMKVNIPTNQVNFTKEYVMNFLLDSLDKRLKDLEKELKDYIKQNTKDNNSLPLALTEYKAKRIISFNYSRVAQNVLM